MKLCVVDASVIGPMILPDEADLMPAGLEPVMVEGRALVPQHWRLEVLNLARMALRRKRIDHRQMEKALASLSQYRIHVDEGTNVHAWGACMRLAERHDLTAYDAAYIELAKRVDAPLLTLDKALAKAARHEKLELIA